VSKQLITLSKEELEKKYRERTLVMCKPDSVQLGNFGDIINRICRMYYKIVLLKMFQFSEESVFDFYGPVIDMWEPRHKIENIFKKLTEAPTIAIVVEGPNSRVAMRKMAGGLPTYSYNDGKIEFDGFKAQFEPLNAPMGTFRGDYCALDIPVPDTELVPVSNFIHATETKEDYDRELNVLMKYRHISEEDFFCYSKPQWEVIYGKGRGEQK